MDNKQFWYIPGDTVTVVNGEQELMKSVGLGIQLPLLWHVTLRTTSSVVLMLGISFSQINTKTKPS